MAGSQFPSARREGGRSNQRSLGVNYEGSQATALPDTCPAGDRTDPHTGLGSVGWGPGDLAEVKMWLSQGLLLHISVGPERGATGTVQIHD